MFTPNTLKALDFEIRRNSDNIESIDKTISDKGVKQSVKDNLLEERQYLLDQKAKHLASSLQAGKNTPLNDIDADNLHKDITLLREKVNTLYDKSENNHNRLEVITEESSKRDNNSS